MLATTRVAVLRGTTESPLGDEVETDAVVTALRDIPASLIERSRNVFDPSSQTRRTVRVITCRIPSAVGHPDTGVITPVALQDGDRIRDNVTGRVYALSEQIVVPRSIAGQASITLDLKATASA